MPTQPQTTNYVAHPGLVVFDLMRWALAKATLVSKRTRCHRCVCVPAAWMHAHMRFACRKICPAPTAPLDLDFMARDSLGMGLSAGCMGTEGGGRGTAIMGSMCLGNCRGVSHCHMLA